MQIFKNKSFLKPWKFFCAIFQLLAGFRLYKLLEVLKYFRVFSWLMLFVLSTVDKEKHQTWWFLQFFEFLAACFSLNSSNISFIYFEWQSFMTAKKQTSKQPYVTSLTSFYNIFINIKHIVVRRLFLRRLNPRSHHASHATRTLI